jgi:hypothetical protein
MSFLLTDLKYFNRVKLIFCIRGHTKNVCDCLFNQLKLRWHKKNTYTMTQMVECLNSQPNVTFIEVKSDIFKDYGALFGRFYKQFSPGTIQKNHIFWVDSTNATMMFMKASYDSPSTYNYDFNNDKRQLHVNRFMHLQAASLAVLPCPGIKPIKQVELYKKWQPFVPSMFHDEICPRPSDEVLEAVRNEKMLRVGSG